MKLENMTDAFKKRYGSRQGEWAARCCMNNTAYTPDQKETFARLWEEAETYDGFLEEARGLPVGFMVNSQGWAEIAKLEQWEPVAREVKLESSYIADSGTIRFGDPDGAMSVSIPNGWGDGELPLYIVERPGRFERNFAAGMFDLAGMIEGEFQVYPYDCAELQKTSGEALALKGCYFVYVRNGTVVLEEQ